MFLVYEHNTGIIHISFYNVINSSISRGIYIHWHKKYYFNNEIFYVEFNFYIKNLFDIPDIRFIIRNIFIRNLILIFLKFLNIIFLFLNKIKGLIYKFFKQKLFFVRFIIIILIILLFFYGFFICGVFEHKNIQKEKFDISVIDWKNIFTQSKLSEKIGQNKFSYIKGEIPTLSGILEFKILPIFSKEALDLNYFGYISVPFDEVISIRSDGSAYYLELFKNCFSKESHKMSIFKITSQDEVLIFKNKLSQYSHENYNYVIFSEKYVSNKINICEFI